MIILGVIIIAAALAVFIKDNIENLFAVSIIAITIVAYFFARLGAINLVLDVPLLLSTISAIYLGYKLRCSRGDVVQYILTPGFAIFVLYCLIIALFCIGRSAAGSPDAQYWLTIAKGIYYDESYWEQLNFFSEGTAHPQFIAIWAYLSEKTWFHWSDGVILATNNILLISYLMPFFSFMKKPDFYSLTQKNNYYAKIILLGLCVFIFVYISDTSEYSVYASDMAMALAFGMGVALFQKALSSEMRRYYIYALAFFMSAVVIKRVAIVVLSICFIWIFYLLIEKKEYIVTILYVIAVIIEYALLKSVDKYILVPVGALLCAIFCYIMKKINSVMLYCIVAFLGCFLLIAFLVYGTLSYGRAEEIDQFGVMTAYMKMLVTTDKYYVGELIHLPISLFIVLNIMFFIYAKNATTICSEKYDSFVFIGLIIFTVLYLILMFYLYMTEIAAANGKMFQSALLGLSRYMKIIPIFFLCYWMGMIIHKVDIKSMSVVLITIMLLAKLNLLLEFVFISDDKIVFPEIDKIESIINKDDTIAYIDMGDISRYNDFYFNLFYKTNVMKVDELSWTYRSASDMCYIDSRELANILDGADYLYIYNADENFVELYNDLFADPFSIDTSGELYFLDNITGKYIPVFSQ